MKLQHPILNNILQNIKKKLIIAKKKKYKGSKCMVEIGSGTYINVFKRNQNKNIIKYPLAKKKLLLINYYIYSKNIKNGKIHKHFCLINNPIFIYLSI